MSGHLKSFCIIPFIHLTSKPNGAVRLCCFSKKYIKDKDGKQLFFGKDSFEKIWNGHEMRNIRISMLNGKKLSECQNCWDEEKNGKESKRIRENRRFFENHKDRLETAQKNKGYLSKYPSYLDLRLGNKCNLKCRTCNPLFSSSWYRELKKHEKDMNRNATLRNTYESDFNMSENVTDWYKTKEFFDLIKEIRKDLRLIYISGGEPFLIRDQHLFIDYFLKTGVYKNISINMTTSLACLDRSLLKKLTKFKKLHLSASVDAYGDKNNWMRSPSQFPAIDQNMNTVLQLSGNVQISINCTVSVYNILYIRDLIIWSRRIAEKSGGDIPIVYFDMLHSPKLQHIRVLPPSLKKTAIKRLQSIIEEIELFPTEKEDINSLIKTLGSTKENDDVQALRTQLKEHTKMLDQWRNEDFFSVFPDFKDCL